jgi:hypothetical protein
MGESEQEYSLSSLQYFLAKVAIVTAALLIAFHIVWSAIDSFLTAKAEQLSVLKGGPAFWGSLERQLYKLADAPEMPLEQKQKIIDALHRVALKYRPYLEALGDDRSPAKQDSAKP